MTTQSAVLAAALETHAALFSAPGAKCSAAALAQYAAGVNARLAARGELRITSGANTPKRMAAELRNIARHIRADMTVIAARVFPANTPRATVIDFVNAAVERVPQHMRDNVHTWRLPV